MAEARRRVLIVGASAAGLRCACRLARLRPDWSVRVVEARQIFSYAACGLPYVLSGDISDLDELRATDYGLSRDADFFAGHKGVEVLTGHRATAIDLSRQVLVAESAEGRVELPWDELVLASGAAPRRLPNQPDHPRVVPFHSWEDVKPLKQGLARGELERIAVVGAGLVGCELAEAFRTLWGAEVALIEAASDPLPDLLDPDLGRTVAREMSASGVELLLGSPVERLEADADGVKLWAGGRNVEAQVVVVAVGVEPATALARSAGLALGAGGAVAVNERLATSTPHVWAAGDCIEVRHAVTGQPTHLPLGSLANRQGRTLANVLAGWPDVFPPVAGAVALKVFDWNIAAVGCGQTRAESQGMTARAVWTSAHDCANYWPEAKEIHIKLIYDPASRRVLGVQAAGEGEVAKRVDAATQLICRGATLEQLAHLEHAYAPPYAPAVEPLAAAAATAQNQEDGVEAAQPFEDLDRATVLDVRLPEEAAERPAGPAGATKIPLGELRSRLDEVDPSTDLVVCERGTRSAEAVRLLRGRGIQARYLGGGMRWRRS
jgi:NADPH-dependent 2,4-dienoyl-CoA reductase/sulfur reductase-like enzyme/rhodanese-related sulfurtransferase